MGNKNCVNCMYRVPLYDGTEVVRNECRQNHGMRVNCRMSCEEWRSDDTTTSTQQPVFAVSVTEISTQKTRRS